MLKTHEITQELIGNIIRKVMFRWVGGKLSQRRYSYPELAEYIDVHYRTVENWMMIEGSAPDVSSVLRLCTVPKLGPRIRDQIMREVLGCTVIPQPTGETNHFGMNAVAASCHAVLGMALADGIIDHTEQPAVNEAMRTLHIETGKYLAQHDSGAVKALSEVRLTDFRKKS